MGELLVRYCAPTLAGLKTGSLFSVSASSPAALARELRDWNRRLNAKDVAICALRLRQGKALIYVYRKAMLTQDLQKKDVQAVLQEAKYSGFSDHRWMLLQLRERILHAEGFPHEIGLFLGYPAEDVRGFMEKKGKDCHLVGCWKVYGDAACAKRRFARYQKCKQVYLRQFSDGRSVEQLTVAFRRPPKAV